MKEQLIAGADLRYNFTWFLLKKLSELDQVIKGE